MLTAKYKKIGSAAYVSHIDVLRTVGRIFARADVKIKFSEGFNPHPLIFFSPPNAVGVESLCEYFCVATDDDGDFLSRFNNAAPQGFEAVRVWRQEKNPNLANAVTAAQYLFKAPELKTVNVDAILSSSEFVVSFNDKNGQKTKDYRSYVLSLQKPSPDEICAVLKFGNENLRPDRFLQGLCQTFGLPPFECSVTKTHAFADGKDVDDFLTTLSNK